MNAGPAGSAASRSRARLGLGSAAAEREVYKAAPGNGLRHAGAPPAAPPPGRCASLPGRGSARGRGGEWGAAGVRARDTERCPGRPASPAIATDAGDASPPPSRPSGTRRSAAAARPLLEDAVARPAPVRCPGPPTSGKQISPPGARPQPSDPARCPRSPTPWKQPSTRCMSAHPGAAHASETPTPGSRTLHPVHAHPGDAYCPRIPTLNPLYGPPTAPAYSTPHASPRRWQGWGFCHTVSVGESLCSSEFPPWTVLVLSVVVSGYQRQMDPKKDPHSPPRGCSSSGGCGGNMADPSPVVRTQRSPGELGKQTLHALEWAPGWTTSLSPVRLFQGGPGQLWGPTLLPLPAGPLKRELPTCLGLTPDPLTPALAPASWRGVAQPSVLSAELG